MKKIVTLGEIMLRLSTNVGERLSRTNQLSMHYGGAEANVGVSLSHFGFDVYFVSKVPNNSLGLAVERHLHSNGIHTDFLVKGGERLGTYFLEAGVGERSAQVTYDRKYSSFSRLSSDELDLDMIFKEAELFHLSGVTLALSQELRDLALKAMKKAKELGVKTSFDFNYRASLWTQAEASDAIKQLLPYTDHCFCGELDAIYLLGINNAEEKLSKAEKLTYYYDEIKSLYPNIKSFSSTFRTVISASTNKLQGNHYVEGQLYQSKEHHVDQIVDRVGGGDAFASGVLYGILEKLPPQNLIQFGTAASALKHTVYGDANAFTVDEVFNFAEKDPGKIIR